MLFMIYSVYILCPDRDQIFKQMLVKKSVQKHRAVAAQRMTKVVLMFPPASTIYERQNQQLIGSKLMLVSFLYFSNCVYNVMYRNPRMEINNHQSRRLEIDKHPHMLNCDGYMLSNVLLHHTSSSIPLDDVISSHWIASHFNTTPPFLCKIGVALNFIFPPSYSL